MSDSLWPHGLQHTRLPCPSPTPGAYSSSCPLSRWCYPTISSSVVPFSSSLQSFPASGSFPVSQFFASGGQVLEFQLQHQSFQWIPRTDLLYDGLVGSPCSPRDSQESSPTPQFKSINFSAFSLIYGPTLTSIHGYWKNHSFDYMDLVGKVISLLFNMLATFVIAFLPGSKLQSPSTVILEPKKVKSVTASTYSSSICHVLLELDAMIFIFWMLNFRPAFSFSPLSPSSRGFLVPLPFLPLDWCHLHIWSWWHFSWQS